MQPITVFQQNFETARSLIKLYDILVSNSENDFPGNQKEDLLKLANIPDGTRCKIISNDYCLAVFRKTAHLSESFFDEDHLCQLLRQAIVAACSAMDIYFNDKLQQNVMKVLLQYRQSAPKRLRELTMTFHDYFDLEQFHDPNEKLRQVILGHFERRALANIDAITEVAEILGCRDFWHDVGRIIGSTPSALKTRISDIVSRRNDIVHRADREMDEESNDVQLKKVSRAWVNDHIEAVRTLVLAADEVIDHA